jgi:hypothetical protein
MAAVSKISGTQAQYDEFLNWCEHNKVEALRYFYHPTDVFFEPDGIRPITDIQDTDLDMWLVANCTIKWVVEDIREQYEE